MSENTLKTWGDSGGFDSRTPTWTHWGSQGGPKPPAASTDALKIQFVVYNSLYNKLWIFRRKRYNMHFLSRYSDVNQQSFVNKRNTVGTKNDNPEKPSNLLSGPTNVRHFRKISVFHMSLFMKEIYSWSKPNQCSCRIIVFKVQSAIHRFNWSWNDAARLQSSRWVFLLTL